MKWFEGCYQKLRWGDQEARDREVIHDAAISLVGSDCLRLDGSTSLGGSVAVALGKSLSWRETVSCQSLLPHPLFSKGQDHFPARDGDEEEEGEGEGHPATPLEELTTPLLNSALQQDLSDDEAEGEKEEEEEKGVVSSGLGPLMASGSGSMNYGPLLLYPSLNVGRLLETSDSSPFLSRDLSSSLALLESSDTQPTNRSLASYLKICRNHLRFGGRECEFALGLYQSIEAAGEKGVAEEELVNSCRGYPGDGWSLHDHVTVMLNFEMVVVMISKM